MSVFTAPPALSKSFWYRCTILSMVTLACQYDHTCLAVIVLPRLLAINACSIIRTYESAERTGWRLDGSYAPPSPELKALLTSLYAPFNEALRLLLGCDVLGWRATGTDADTD